MKFFKTVSYTLVLSLGLMFTFSSCGSDPEPMELPPAESLVIDLSQFPTDSQKKSAEIGVGNWLYSFLSAAVWNVVVGANVAIPVVAYAEAFNHTPVYLGDNTWEWQYSVTTAGNTYVASLIGERINNETFTMDMTLSMTGGFQNFEWFSGVIRYDHTEANWTLRHSPDENIEYLDISYLKNFETDVASIRYTVTDPANELYNDYIEYGYDSAMDYDAYYDIMIADTVTNIEWSTMTNAGRVKDPRHYNDDLWHCWDGQLLDVACSLDR